MIETNHLDFIEWQELPVPYVPKWWDKPRWWLVRALGGTCPHDAVKVIRVPVNGKDFMERLWKLKSARRESEGKAYHRRQAGRIGGPGRIRTGVVPLKRRMQIATMRRTRN